MIKNILEEFGHQVVLYTECTKTEINTELKRFGCNEKIAQASVLSAVQNSIVVGFTDMTWNCKKSFFATKQDNGLYLLVTYKGKTHEEAMNGISTIFHIILNK